MDGQEVKGENAAAEQLEPLLILEEGDDPEELAINNLGRGKAVLRLRKTEDESEAEGVERAEVEAEEGKALTEDVGVNEEKQQEKVEERPEGGVENEEKAAGGTLEALEMKKVESGAGSSAEEKLARGEMEGPEKVEVKKDLLALPDLQTSAKLRPRDLLRPGDPQQKIHRLSPDFPDALYELLCTLQEGRRLNDQRCSFTMQGRRRCYSEPSTPRHSQKVLFSSMTSLQKEEFFELVATSQARRLDDQRADFQSVPPMPPNPPAVPPAVPPAEPPADPQPKTKARKGSCKPAEAARPVPKAVPKEDLYNMILTSQAQGRLEEQRSVPPGPMDDEDFFSLLLKVQGGRMDEQRTELPITLKY